jgi:hypothetical protein
VIRRLSNNQWSCGIATHPALHPKIYECKIPLKRLSPASKFCDYDGILLVSAYAIEGHLKGKTSQGFYQKGLVLAPQMSGSPGKCNPVETQLPGLPLS